MANRIQQDVLIVDDDESIRNLLRIALRRYGISCHVAADGLEALNHLTEAEYAIVLLDVMMPRMDGIGLATSLRELQKKTGIRPVVMFMTAAPDSEVLAPAGDVVQAVIAKPFDVHEVVEVVHACVKERRLHDALYPRGAC